MKAALLFLCRTFCLLLVAIGFFVGVFAACAVFTLAIVWLQEGQLQRQDTRVLTGSAAWLGGACLFVYVTWRLARLAGENKDFFRYRKTAPAPNNRSNQISLVVLFLMVTPGLWRTLSGPAIIKLPALFGWLILAFLALHLHLLLHELGHFTAAWLMRFDLRKIQVGLGPRLWSCSFANGLRFEWRVWSLGGFVTANNPATKNFRVRQFFFVAAGPIAEVMILWAGYSLIASGAFGSTLLDSAGGFLVGLILLWTALAFVGGIIPRTAWLGDRKVWSDGYWLWLLITGSDKRLATLAAQFRWRDLVESLGSEELPPWLVRASLPIARANAADSLADFRSQHLRLNSPLLRRVRG